MPISYVIDQARRLIFTQVSGVLTIGETIEYFKRLQIDANCPADAIEVVDFAEVSNFMLQYSEMIMITQEYQVAKTKKRIMATVFNCNSRLSYGIGRMLQALHEVANEKHVVVITRSEQELKDCIERLRSNH